MSLEQALADNTAALQAMTAALLKGGTAAPAADKPAKGSGEKAGKAAAYEAKHSKEEYDRRAPFAAPKVMKLKALGRIKPSAEEVAANPRSRSAILRVAQRMSA